MKRKNPLGVMLGLLVVLILAGPLYDWNSAAGSPGRSPRQAHPTKTKTVGIHLGIHLSAGGIQVTGPTLEAWLDCFEEKVGRNHGIVLLYSAWKNHGAWWPLPIDDMRILLDHEATPIILWEPWDWDKTRPPPTLTGIANGDYDAYIIQAAQDAKELGAPFIIAWGHEMNGDWYPWSGFKNGEKDGPNKYIDAWRHIHGIFTAQGAHNVYWLFAPNHESVPAPVGDNSWNAYHHYYPGDGFVDWVGTVGYNRGQAEWWSTPPAPVCRSFDDLFAPILGDMADRFPAKPQLIVEMAATCDNGCPTPDDKASWITTAYESAQSYERLRGVVWFNQSKVEGRSTELPKGKLQEFRIWCQDPCETPTRTDLLQT